MSPPRDPAASVNGTPAAGAAPSANGAAPAALPAGAGLERLPLPVGGSLELATVAVAESAPGSAVAQHEPAQAAAVAAAWVAAAPLVEDAGHAAAPIITVPLYDSHVVWSPARAAVVGPASRLGQLRAALAEFAAREADLRDAEQRVARLLDGSESDAAVTFASDERLAARGADAAARYREAIAVRRRLAGLTAAIHTPPVHPPTLASQLGERLRDRTRLAERHEQAVEKAELVERVAEACGQRAADLVIARRQLALEWAIVALLVAQTVLLLVDALASRGTP